MNLIQRKPQQTLGFWIASFPCKIKNLIRFNLNYSGTFFEFIKPIVFLSQKAKNLEYKFVC